MVIFWDLPTQVSISRSTVQDACGRTAVVVGQGTSAAAADWTGLGWGNASNSIHITVVIAEIVTTDFSTGVVVTCRRKAWVVLARDRLRGLACGAVVAGPRTFASEGANTVHAHAAVQAWAVP